MILERKMKGISKNFQKTIVFIKNSLNWCQRRFPEYQLETTFIDEKACMNVHSTGIAS